MTSRQARRSVSAGILTVRTNEDVSYVFVTAIAAQREIADHAMTQLHQFTDGRRDFDDAITVDEYIVTVTVNPNGSIMDEDERRSGKKT